MTTDRCAILEGFATLRSAEPDRVLVRAGDRRWTAADVDSLATVLGRRLGGLPPATAVALYAGNGVGLLAGLVAIRRSGHAALLLDPASPRSERWRVATSLGAAAVLTVGTRANGDSWCTLGRAHGDPPARREVAVIKLTSGTTGLPRGVAATSEALVADCLRIADGMGISADDAILAAVPMSFSYGLSSVALPALLCGNRVVVPPQSPLGLLHPDVIGSVDVVPTTPAVVHAMSRLGRGFSLPDRVRLVIAAGSPVRPAQARRFRRRFGRAVHVFYGATECGGITFDPTGTSGEHGTVGVPLPGVDVSLEGDGRVTVRSDAVASGYLGESGGSDALCGDGVFRTGDVGMLREGELTLLGRLADRVILAGRKVDLAEIERVLLRAKGVEDACVVADAGRDDERASCTAFVVPRSGADLDVGGLLSSCRRHLAPYKVPRSLKIVNAIPRTERGKPDREELAAAARVGSA